MVIGKPGLSSGAKTALVVVLSLSVIFVGWFIVSKMGSNKATKRFNDMIKLAADDNAKELSVNKEDFKLLMEAADNPGRAENREVISKAIFLAKASDGTDLDTMLVEFVTKQAMAPDIRKNLIAHVVRKRNNPLVVPLLMTYCRTTSDPMAAIAAIEACRFMAGEKEVPKYVDIIEFNDNGAIRQAVEENLVEILGKSTNREAVGERILASQHTAAGEAKYSLTRLVGAVGGDKAKELITKALVASDQKEHLAAIKAIGNWPDDSMFETLMEHYEKLDDKEMNRQAFNTAYQFLSQPGRKRDAESSETCWKLLARNAKTNEEQLKVVSGLVTAADRDNANDDWVESILNYFVDESSFEAVQDKAEKGIDHIRSRSGVKNSKDENSKDENSKDEKDKEKKDE